MLGACDINTDSTDNTVNIVVTHTDNEFIMGDYYIDFLEEQSGLEINFTYIADSMAEEYMRMLFMSENNSVDAILFSNKSDITTMHLSGYIESGSIAPLDDLIDAGGYFFKEKCNSFDKYNLLEVILYEDGSSYYLPAVDDSNYSVTTQAMWINSTWLDATNTKIPTNLQEFEEVLVAFHDYKPDGAPIIGTAEVESSFPFNFIINSFTYSSPHIYYFDIEDGQVYFPPVTDEWRQALIYLNSLYDRGLIVDENFTYNNNQFKSICNSNEDLVGMFATNDTYDILIEDSSDIWSDYMILFPLDNGERNGYALEGTFSPTIGAIIPQNSTKQAEVFSVMDLMYSDDSYIYSHYGVEGQDWEYSLDGDITARGTDAVITVNARDIEMRSNQIREVAGPYIANPYYSDSVAWKGFQVRQSEFSQIRTYKLYEPYIKEESLSAAVFYEFLKEYESEYALLASYTKEQMIAFIRGDVDVNNDAHWQAYLDSFDAYQLDTLIQRLAKVL